MPFRGPRLTKAITTIGRAAGARMLRPVILQSGDVYAFLRSDKKVQDVADAIDLGTIETVDETARKLVLTLDASKVPE
jgi:hypothetical protein